MSSPANTFVTNPTLLLARDSSNAPISGTVRLIGPRPYYPSQMTPEPTDSSIQHRQLIFHNLPPRRYSVHQMNALDVDDDNASISSSSSSSSSSMSDESLSLEFPPPPPAFLTPSNPNSESHQSQFEQTTRKIPFISDLFNRSDSGSPMSNSYLSDQESSPSTRTVQTHSSPIYRPSNRALISVSSGQTPVITIAGSPQRSEIRVSSSPQTSKSSVREIRISRPDSPSISINRTGSSQPLIFTTGSANAGGTTISNSGGGSFHISLGSPGTHSVQLGRNSTSIQPLESRRNSVDNIRYVLNNSSNRMQPFVNFATATNNISSSIDRPTTVLTLPPVSSSIPMTVRNGHTLEQDGTEIEPLSKLFLKNMQNTIEQDYLGKCARCNDTIVGEENGLSVMDRMYHVPCFTCSMCGCRLRGMHFYSMENQPHCESCYVNSLEKCVHCGQPITDRILRATGKPYHAQCFCCVTCQKSLDGVPFTVDANMEIHCIECFHQKFAPRCFVCHRIILPDPGQQETTRIVALDRSYHIECYRCENCQVQFTSDEGCYPVNDHILCLPCNRLFLRTVLGQP